MITVEQVLETLEEQLAAETATCTSIQTDDRMTIFSKGKIDVLNDIISLIQRGETPKRAEIQGDK